MFKATKEIYEAILSAKLKATVEDMNEASMVCVQFPLAHSAPFVIRFVSTDDDNDVAVRVDLMRVKEDEIEALLPLLNRFNNKFRYAKFTLDDENDIFIGYDMPMNGGNVGECAMEMVTRFGNIIYETHPQLLRAALAAESKEGTLFS